MISGAAPPKWVTVAVPVPMYRTFTYRVPDDVSAPVVRGHRVLLPWRQKTATGVVIDTPAELPDGLDAARVRPIADLLDPVPTLPDAQLALCEWVARYYHVPLGEAVDLAVPSATDVRAGVEIELVAPERSPGSDVDALLIETLLAEETRRLPLDVLLARSRRLRHLDVHRLEEAGAVVRHIVAGAQRVRPRTTLQVRATGAEPPPRLGERQRQVLAFLYEEGATTADELRDLYGTPRSVLTGLARHGAVEIEEVEVYRDPFDQPVALRESEPALTPEQSAALDRLLASRTTAPQTTLLHGVTGSGKTEVYVRMIRQVIDEGKRALVLLPEIALTPQFVATFRSVLGDRIAVQHSGLTPGQRYDQWRRIRDGSLPVVIGARSAIFAPIRDLGVIVVDEEHDASFKQDTGVPYHARDLAIVLGARVGCAVVLGSATPSLESLRNARLGKYGYAAMPTRANRRPMPKVRVLDRSRFPPMADDPVSQYLSEPLETAVRETVQAGNQAILFLNRRGFAPVLRCGDCGSTVDCPDCDVTLTWHRRGNVLRCHYCGFSAPAPTHCPTCGSTNLEKDGVGTERVEHEIAERFEGLRLARLDADTARGPALLQTLDRFRKGGADVLIGTQMVTKGHDFPNVTLVGVLNADQSLRFPDFRSGERTFQLLTQVAGRAGRAEKVGEVIVQTWNPSHHVIQSAALHDYERFAERELRLRERLGYPPFGHAAAVRFDAPRYEELAPLANRVIDAAGPETAHGLRIVGPVDAPLTRVRGRYRMHCLLLSPERPALHRAVDRCLRELVTRTAEVRKADLRATFDVDPQQLM